MKENIGPSSEVVSYLIDITGMSHAELANHLNELQHSSSSDIKAEGTPEINNHEYILQLFQLIKKGLDTFGELEAVKSWLSHESIAMNARPIDIINTPTGIQIVLDELIRIDYGITVFAAYKG